LHAETALGTGRMTSTFECSKKWGDYPANYDKLLMKRGRFVYYRSPGFEADLLRHHLSGQIRILPTAMETIPFYILFYQRTSPARLALFGNALQRLADSGELADLAKRYP
ncbi:hypothetical protein ACV1DG_11380, partial [Aeromonas hydrophila]